MAVVAALHGAARLPGALRWPLAGRSWPSPPSRSRCSPAAWPTSTCGPTTGARCCPGIGRGIDALPGVRVPYQGVDEWTRVVIGRGRHHARRRRRAGRLLAAPRGDGLPAGGADPARHALRRARRRAQLRRRVPARRAARAARARVPAAREAAPRTTSRPRPAVAAARPLAALVAAPALDGRQPWWDYESWAVETAGARAVGFSWDHDYGPLDWPRDGRELLRVRARLGRLLEGARPRRLRRAHLAPGPAPAPGRRLRAAARRPSASLARWTQQMRVTLRNLRSDTFVTAGITTRIGGGRGRLPDRRRRLRRARRAQARRLLHGGGLHAAADRARAARRGHRLRGLARRLPRDLPPADPTAGRRRPTGAPRPPASSGPPCGTPGGPVAERFGA